MSEEEKSEPRRETAKEEEDRTIKSSLPPPAQGPRYRSANKSAWTFFIGSDGAVMSIEEASEGKVRTCWRV